MTVLENLLVAAEPSIRDKKRKCLELMKIFELDGLENEIGRNLSYGQKKQSEFARVLLMNSDLILLDEPMSGLTPSMIGKCFLISTLQKRVQRRYL